MITNLASSITKAASKQTYYTIRFLVDRQRVEDAYRAYAYFRWVDDILDAEPVSGSVLVEGEAFERRDFLEQQKSILESCYRGEPPRVVSLRENMLVELILRDQERNSGLQSYLRNMMQVLDFDSRRRGRQISQVELKEYTHWLATAVTEAMHYFIGHDDFAPHDETRYLLVSAAHITHLLRDTFEDVHAGYYNIPREVLESNHIQPQEIHSNVYRDWVKSRTKLAREYFEVGKGYLAQVQNPRCRMAGVAYSARFEWLLDTIEREDYFLRPEYNDRRSPRSVLQLGWQVLLSMLEMRAVKTLAPTAVSNPLSKPR